MLKANHPTGSHHHSLMSDKPRFMISRILSTFMTPFGRRDQHFTAFIVYDTTSSYLLQERCRHIRGESRDTVHCPGFHGRLRRPSRLQKAITGDCAAGWGASTLPRLAAAAGPAAFDRRTGYKRTSKGDSEARQRGVIRQTSGVDGNGGGSGGVAETASAAAGKTISSQCYLDVVYGCEVSFGEVNWLAVNSGTKRWGWRRRWCWCVLYCSPLLSPARKVSGNTFNFSGLVWQNESAPP